MKTAAGSLKKGRIAQKQGKFPITGRMRGDSAQNPNGEGHILGLKFRDLRIDLCRRFMSSLIPGIYSVFPGVLDFQGVRVWE